MRKYLSILLLFMSSIAFGQYRSIGTGTWTTLTDSTYVSTVQVSADLTGGGFLALDITTGFRVFSGTGQIYEITNVSLPLFFQATLTIKEIYGTQGSPSSKVMIFDPQGRESLPQVPFAASGATGQLQAAVDTYNARINGSFFRDTSIVDVGMLESELSGILTQKSTRLARIYSTYTDTITSSRVIEFPDPSLVSNQGVSISIDNINPTAYRTYIESDTFNQISLGNGYYADQFYIDEDETVDVTNIGNKWKIQTEYPKEIILSSYDQFYTRSFFRGQTIWFAGNKYEVNTLPAIKGITGLLTVDSTFVIPIQDKAPWSWNRVDGSLIGNAGSNTHFNTTTSPAITGPDGKPSIKITKGKDYITGTDDYVAWSVDQTGLNVNDTITFSFQYLIGEEDFNNDLIITASPENASRVWQDTNAIVLDTIEKKWVNYSVTWTIRTVSTTLRPSIVVTGMDDNDYFHIANVQWETGSVATDKKHSDYGGHVPGQLYAILNPESKIDFTKIHYDGDYQTNSRKIQATIDNCDALPNCYTSEFIRSFTQDSTLTLPLYYQVTGTGNRKENDVTISVSIPDSTVNVIELENDGTYARNQKIENLTFDILDTAQIIINADKILRTKFNNLYLDGNSITDVGIKISDGAIGSLISDVEMTQLDTAIYFNGAGAIHQVERTFINTSGVGIYSRGGSLINLDQIDIEGGSGPSIWANKATDVFVKRSYFEDGPMWIDTASMFVYKESRQSNPGNNDIRLQQVRMSDIQDNRFYQDFTLDNQSTDNIVDFSRNLLETDKSLLNTYYNYRDDERVRMSMNSTFAGQIQDRSTNHLLYSRNSDFHHIGLRDSSYQSNRLFLVNSPTWQGFTQNLISYSDSLGASGVVTAAFTVVGDTLVSPETGLTTADVIAITSTPGGTQAWNGSTKTLTTPISAGTKFNVSFWAKPLTTDPSLYIRVRANGDVNHEYDFGATQIEGWYRYDRALIAQSTITSISLRLGDQITGDSVAISDMQITSTYNMVDYVRTTTTGIDDNTTNQVTVGGDGSLDFIGSLTNVDSLKWQHYTPTGGDTIVLDYNTVIYLGSGDTIYIDESALTSNAMLKVVQSSGTGTILKEDGATGRFNELGAAKDYSLVIGQGSVKTLFYRYAVNHWYTTEYLQPDIPITAVSTTTDTVVVYRGMDYAIDGTSGSYTVQLDVSELYDGQKFTIRIGDIGASTVTLDVLDLGSVIVYENDAVAATKAFTGTYVYLHCWWDGSFLYVTR